MKNTLTLDTWLDWLIGIVWCITTLGLIFWGCIAP